MLKKDNDQPISITNPKIINFFSKHSNLNPEDTIISFIDSELDAPINIYETMMKLIKNLYMPVIVYIPKFFIFKLT